MQLRVSATALAILLSAPLTFAGTLAPGGGPTTGVLDANSNVGTTLATTLAGEDVTGGTPNGFWAWKRDTDTVLLENISVASLDEVQIDKLCAYLTIKFTDGTAQVRPISAPLLSQALRRSMTCASHSLRRSPTCS